MVFFPHIQRQNRSKNKIKHNEFSKKENKIFIRTKNMVFQQKEERRKKHRMASYKRKC